MAIVNHKNKSTTGVDQDALSTSTSGEQIINFGDLTTKGDLANGIFAGADNILIQNFGGIETFGLGAAGIYVEGVNAHIANHGSVVTHGDFFDPDPAVDGDEFSSEGIFADGDRFFIANYGSVHVEGLFSSGLLGVGADGAVINYGRIDSTAEGGVVIAGIGDFTRAINNGQVTATGDDIAAVLVRGEGAAAINRSDLTVTGAGVVGMLAQLRDGHLTNDGVIHISGDDSFGMLGLGDGQQIDNFGSIETRGIHAIGIEGIGGLFFPAGQDINIVNGGHITTVGNLAIGVALGLPGAGSDGAIDGTIVNSGVIKTDGDGAAGVLMFGDGHHLTNSGRITTDGGAFEDEDAGLLHAAGVLVSGDDGLVVNTRAGVIESKDAASAAVELNVVERDGFPTTFLSSELDNFGLIKGAGIAVLGGAGQETVVNHGSIVGDVVLDDGADTFVFGKSGSLAGNLFLGAGNDIVGVENGSGTSRVADFVATGADHDVADVSAFFSSFNEVEAHSSQQGADVVIALDHNDNLVLQNVQISALNAGDFFV